MQARRKYQNAMLQWNSSSSPYLQIHEEEQSAQFLSVL